MPYDNKQRKGMNFLKKVLIVLTNLRICNGVASYIMNYYRHLNHSQIKMDFCLLNDVPSPYYEDIKKNGDKIIILPSVKKFAAYNSFIENMFKEGHYDIVHSNVLNNSIQIMSIAKKMGVKTRIQHSHATKLADIKWRELRNKMLAPLALKNANTYFACSKLAGDYLFGNSKYTLIKNALDLSRFYIDNEVRASMQKEMELENKFIVGTIGRICPQKNPFFALDVFKEVLKIHPDSVYLWIGSGPLDDKAKEYAQKIGISENVRYLGNREDVPRLYQAMDVFFLPSLYEGLPVVGMEAQACGLPMVVADTVTTEMKITDNVDYLSLSSPLSQWANALLKYKDFERYDTHRTIIENGYEISVAAKKLEEMYLSM